LLLKKLDYKDELVLDNLSDEQVLSILSNPSPIDELAKIEPKVLNHKEWFGRLIIAINEILTDEGDDGINDDIENNIVNDDLPSEMINAIKQSEIIE
jgi:hypothetical protein